MTVVVAAIILDEQGNILCAKRGDWKSLPGKWEFPGGKANEGEELTVALMRESKKSSLLRSMSLENLIGL